MRCTLIWACGAHRISNYPHNNDSLRRDTRNDVAYVRQPRWTHSRRHIRRNRVVPPRGEGDGRARYSACYARWDVRACVQCLSLSRRTRPRDRMEKYESFLRAINASAYSQGRPRARCCIHLSGGAVPPSHPLGTSVIISWNPARRTERAKRGSKNASIDRSEREPGIRRASRGARLSRNRVISLFTRNGDRCARKTKHFLSSASTISFVWQSWYRT